MVEVSYHCPYCGAVTTLDRDAYLEDKCVTAEPLAGWEYAATTDDYESADGVEFVCIGDVPGEGRDAAADRPAGDVPGEDGPDPAAEGCGRTFYLSFVKFEGGSELEPPGGSLEDEPSFEFLR